MKEIRELEKEYVFDAFFEELIDKKCDIRETLSIDSTESISAIDNCDLGKKFFLVFDGALRQFIIKKQVFFPFTFRYCRNGSMVRGAVQLEVCGLGKIWVNCGPNCNSFGELPFDCFETIEDYKMGEPYEVNYKTITPSNLAALFLNMGICNFAKEFTTYRASLYKWDGVKCVRCDVSTNVRLCIIWDGYLYIPFKKAQHPYYVSEKECVENNSLRVKCFDDNEEAEEEAYIALMDIKRVLNRIKTSKNNTSMKKSVRVRFACEVYFDFNNAEGKSNNEIRATALREFENLPIFSADALDKFADMVEVESVEDAESGEEL